MGHRLRSVPGPIWLLALWALSFTPTAMPNDTTSTNPANQLDAIVAGGIAGSPPC